MGFPGREGFVERDGGSVELVPLQDDFLRGGVNRVPVATASPVFSGEALRTSPDIRGEAFSGAFVVVFVKISLVVPFRSC